MRKRGWRVCPLTEHTLPWGPPREEEEEVVRGSPLVLVVVVLSMREERRAGCGRRESSHSSGLVVGLEAALHRPPSVSLC